MESVQLHNFIIYKTINLNNGKIYIGQHRRGKLHYLGSGVAFRQAFKKYGRENFRRDVLEELKNCTQERANGREVYWIKKLKSRNPKIGYNLATGGLNRRGRIRLPGTYKHSEETMIKVRAAAEKRRGLPAWNRGRNDYLTEESLKKMRRPKSEESKEKMRGKTKTVDQINKAKATKQRKKDEGYVVKYKTKKVVQIDKDGKETIWPSVTKAANSLKIKISDVSRVCKGIGKTCGGYKWKYFN